MIGMKLNQAKALFFDRKAVTSAVDRGTRKVLSKFGAFVRTTAKTSIRKRKGSAPPGKPPHCHVGILRRLIFFAFEPVRRSVVIGPKLASRSTGEAPSLLEHGGSTQIQDRRGKARRAAYKPRPYMGPAFQKEQQKLPAMWRDSVNPRT